jgi:uridylate kinase
MSTKILSVGGSIVAPEYPDTEFVKEFVKMIKDYLSNNKDDKLILVIGGGGPARIYQKAFREVADISETSEVDAADWIGIMATRLNAQFIKASFGELCQNDVVTDPTIPLTFSGRILLAAGWKPGFSTDNDAVLLAEKFNADTVVNLSNIEKVYTDDPRKNPNAKRYAKLTYQDILNEKLEVMDQTAASLCNDSDIDVIVFDMNKSGNIKQIMIDPSIGTIVSNK